MYKRCFFLLLINLVVGCQEIPDPKPILAKSVPVLEPLSRGGLTWHLWADRDSARVVNKPILLFLYHQRSFWCRDLVNRCFNDPELVQAIERIAWPIRVDVDKQPDVFERFSLGGVPTVAFLKPNEEWIAGGKYLDPNDLMDLVRRVSFPFANPDRMDALEIQRKELQRRSKLWSQKNPRPQIAPSEVLLKRVLDSLAVAVDRGIDIGAEGTLALFEARQSIDNVTSWLNTRHDTDGVFFLFSHTLDGKVVDREKHLGMNASMLATLALVGKVHEKIGGVGRDLGEALLESFVVDSLFCAGFAAFETSDGVPQDSAVYAGWNGLAISGLMTLYMTTRESRFRDAALLSLDVLERRFRQADGMFGHVEGQTFGLLLEDQAFVARAALDVYDNTGEAKYLQLARELADGMLARFADVSGALRDRDATEHPVFPVGDGWLPSANGVAAQVFIRLAQITQKQVYQDAAQGILTALIGPDIDGAASMGALCRALSMYVTFDKTMQNN